MNPDIVARIDEALLKKMNSLVTEKSDSIDGKNVLAQILKQMDSTDFEMFAKLGIPVNEPVYLGNIEELSQIVHILAYEHYSAEANHEEIEKRYLEIFVLKLGRAVQSMSAASPELFAERNYKLTQLRGFFCIPWAFCLLFS